MEWRIAAAAVSLLLTSLIGLSSTQTPKSTTTTGRPTTTSMDDGRPPLPNGYVHHHINLLSSLKPRLCFIWQISNTS